MGLEIPRERFEEHEYRRFSKRLEESLEALAGLLARDAFGVGPITLGAELELSLVDRRARPLPLNVEVLARTVDPRLTFELDRFNLECNLRHGPLAGRPFEALGVEIEGALREVRRASSALEARVATVGILPTLESQDLQSEAMTDSRRYRALSHGIRRLRQGPFHLHITGDDVLDVECDDVTFEGAATSFQIHLRASPAHFTARYNALQLATPFCLAASGNSPFLLGKRLWEETRVALFKQAVDHRTPLERGSGREPRVSFGRDWLAGSPLALFEENVVLHEPLLPVLDGEAPCEVLARGELPSLRELRLHQGTVWRWNRAIYDPHEGGHLRMEARFLPSGPTVVDMLANTAFLVGLTLAFEPDVEAWTRGISFQDVSRAFYRAGRQGLAAELPWAEAPGAPPEERPAPDWILALIPAAQAGLDAAGVERSDSEPLLAVLESRVRAGTTGARWQRQTAAQLERRMPRAEALAGMLEAYLRRAEEGRPVHEWPVGEKA